MSQRLSSATNGTANGWLEVVGGPTGRRRPDAIKARIIQESFAPSASVSAVAHRRGISPHKLTGWRRDARDGLMPLNGDRMDAPKMPRPPCDPISRAR
jgi:transposase